MVQTVCGEIDAAELGFTYMHEHVVAATPGFYTSYPERWDEEQVRREATERLHRLRGKGVTAIVDMTPADFHRIPELVRDVSQETGVHIVHATGGYWHSTLFFEWQPMERIAELFLGDIEQGMNGTDVRSGILKFASDAGGMTPTATKIGRAVARVHQQTGVPISTHSHMASRGGLAQLELLEREGVDLSRVIIGHSNDTRDVEYLELLIAQGAWVGMDRFGIDMILPNDERIDLLVEMCERGHADRIVLSHDVTCYGDWIPPDWGVPLPNWVQTHVTDHVVPALLEHGVTPEQIDQMLVGNPRRIFECQGAY